MHTSELDYDLPDDRVATTPAEPRDSAKLMVVNRAGPSRVEHHAVRDLPRLLRPGDLLVFNTTRVAPARLVGVRRDTGGRVEGLYLRHTIAAEAGTPALAGESANDRAPERWIVLLRAKRLRNGVVIDLRAPDGEAPVARLRLLARYDYEPGAWVVDAERVSDTPGGGGETGPGSLLALVGWTPLPPYIRGARRLAAVQVPEADDRERYQTVYARSGASVAAPTAGLHFTPGLLDALALAGVRRADVELSVGTGTFRPIEAERVEDHPMHAESCTVDEPAAAAIRDAKRESRRVIAVGTTTARTLETHADAIESGAGPWPRHAESRLLITPGHRWRCVDGLLTNFHLPRSTLLAMVGAMFDDGVPRVKELYAHAIERGYRFYSYGDAMLVV